MAETNPFDLPHMQELQTTEQKKLFDAIDSLRSYGLGNVICLPQMVVCGGQSTGKSSVLEAISGVPFPRNVGLCTRFATEIILRRDSTTEIKVSLIPGPFRSAEEEKRLRAFQHDLTSYDDLPGLVARAQETMSYSTTRSGMTFSQDVLRIEVSGPKQPQLSIVDLPGIIQAGTDEITNEDISLVENLVMSYINKPRSIILAIITASTDPENQVVLRRAHDADPDGSRTIGIITKPDTLAKGTPGEAKWLALARNERSKLKLGWHVVKNVDSNLSANGGKDRDAEEEAFFRDSRFKADPGRKLGVGIASLRERLSKILFDQIRDTIHPLLKDMEVGIVKCKEELKRLGEARPEPYQQRAYLVRISQRFSNLCREAVYGHYKDAFFNESDPHTRLCARLMEGHDRFAQKIIDLGSEWQVSEGGVPRNTSARTQAITKAKRLLRQNRGTELPGLQNSEIIHQLFLEHSKDWEGIAQKHIRDSRLKIQRFLNDVASTLASEDICENLLDVWINPTMSRRLQEAHSELAKLTNVHKQPPMTTNQSFWRTVHQIQGKIDQKKVLDAIQDKLNAPREVLDKSGEELKLEALQSMSLGETNDIELMNATKSLDIMQAYYELAANLFMDNVPTLVIWATMVNDLPQIFSPDVVMTMDQDTIARIAQEPEHIVAQREELQTRLEMLEKGQEECELQISKSHFADTRSSKAAIWKDDSPAPNFFGAQATVPSRPSSTGLFSTSNNTTNGVSGPGLFGNTNNSNRSPSPVSFPNTAVTPNSNLFPTPTIFQPQNSASRPASAQSGGLFGGSQNSNATTPSSTPAPTPGGLFGGSQNSNATTPSSTPAPTQGGGLFGTTSQNTNGFGNGNGNTPASKPAFGGFGSNAFGASATSGFGKK